MKLRDCDGDIWESDGEGGWEHNTLTPFYDYSYFPSMEVLDQVFGPLSEVDE